MKQSILLAAAIILMYACRQNSSKEMVKDDGFTTDSNWQYQPVTPGNTVVPMGGFDSTAFIHMENNEANKRALLFLSIDSTYSAISQIEEIKNEMSKQSTAGYLLQERNLRAKALNQLNILENMLARQADEAVLANLKKHTAALEAINKQTEHNVERLQSLSEKINKAGIILQNITNVLSFCMSKGVVKPATPVTATAASVKAALP